MRLARIAALLLGLLAAGCAKGEFALWQTKTAENLEDLLAGPDRGVEGFAEMLDRSIIPGEIVDRYDYAPPQLISNYLVLRAAYGLGGTSIDIVEMPSRPEA